MKTLELKDIAGYLPHGLKYKGFEEMEVIYEIDPSNPNLVLLNSGKYEIGQVKPVLRPLSDLYRTITHNGEEIIPIVECAKIGFPSFKWKLEDTKFAIALIDGSNARFIYSEESNAFFIYYNTIEATNNQYKLFDFLHELKIDYRGLIESGLAIDVNTLEINPYK
jgi:hypothetical protein